MGKVLTSQYTFACPFCENECAIADDDTGPVAVLHEAPLCRDFIDAGDALEFMVRARKERERVSKLN